MTLLAYLPGTRAWRKRRKDEICAQTFERIDEIIDGEIPPGKAARVLERHIDACPPCREHADVVRAMKSAIARVSGDADPETVARLQALARRLCEGKDTG